MPKAGNAALVVGSTLIFLFLLLMAQPFKLASDTLDVLFHVPPKWTQVNNVYSNRNTQEITHGDDPVPGLKVLATYWAAHPAATHILFVGNSQMHTVSLARGEAKPASAEKTYVDEIADRLAMDAPGTLTYRLSSSGMSYPEVLWDLTYMMGREELKPDAIVMQLNYQAFWTGGIRDSMLSLLDDEGFRTRIESAAATHAPYAGAFQEALKKYGEQASAHNATKLANTQNKSVATTFSASTTPGYAIETVARGQLDKSRAIRSRASTKEDIVDFLYRCRLYFLRLKPSTARSVTGARLIAARGAVMDIVRLCHAQKVQLYLFSAPVNPQVSLYRTPEDKASYRGFIEEAAKANGSPLYDFEDTVEASHWGSLLNGPDPLHLGRYAHELMAKQMYAAIPLSHVRRQR